MTKTRRQVAGNAGTVLLAACLCLLIGGCASRGLPELTAPAFSMPARFDKTGNAPLDNRWWRAFADPGLNRLMETALTNNFSLRAAYARVEQARAALAAADGFPADAGIDPRIAARRWSFDGDIDTRA